MAENEPPQETSEPAGDIASNTMNHVDLLLSKTQLKTLIDDDVYEILRRHFLMTGKGRRPNLPPVFSLTNWLPIQLFFLKEEADATFAQMRLWLQKLVPKTMTVSESRIYHQVNGLLDSCSKLPQHDALSLLQEEYDFHGLSSPLAALNLKRLHLTNNEIYNQPPSDDVINEVIIALDHLRAQEREGPIFVRKDIHNLSKQHASVGV